MLKTISVEDEYYEIASQLLKQLEEFKKAYGYIPKIQLVVSEDYKKLIEYKLNH